MLVKLAVVSLFALITGFPFNITPTDFGCSRYANETNITNPVDCTRYIRCQANQFVGTFQCEVPANSTGSVMWSPSRRQCVSTNFNNCKLQRLFCPNLSGNGTTNPQLGNFFYINNLDECVEKNYDFTKIYGKMNDKNEFVPFENYVPDESFSCPEPMGLFEVPETDSEFAICVRGNAYRGQCEEGEIFDVDSNDCVQRGNNFRFPNIDNFYDCSTAINGLYGIPNNCRQFQLCCGNVGRMYKCPFGFGFDVPTGQCVFRFLANCAV